MPLHPEAAKPFPRGRAARQRRPGSNATEAAKQSSEGHETTAEAKNAPPLRPIGLDGEGRSICLYCEKGQELKGEAQSEVAAAAVVGRPVAPNRNAADLRVEVATATSAHAVRAR